MKIQKKNSLNYYLIFLLATLLIAVCYSIFMGNEKTNYEAVIRSNIPEAAAITKVVGTNPVYKVTAQANDYYVSFDSSVGYQSRINTMTIVNGQGLLEKVLVVEHGETPTFFERLYTNKYFEQYKDKTVKEPIYIGRAAGYTGSNQGMQTDNSIDAVTSSTISSHAIAEAVNNGTKYISGEFFGTKWNHDPYDELKIKWQDIVLGIAFILAVAAAYFRAVAKMRKWILLYMIVVVGFYINQFITITKFIPFITFQWPKYTMVTWYILSLGSVGAIFLTGRNLYCAWICPFGAVQETINRLAGIKPLGISPSIIRKLELAAPTILWFALMVGIYMNNFVALDYQPFATFFSLKAVWAMWIMLPILIYMNLFFNRFYCTFFCPVGYVLNLINRWRNKGVIVWREKRNALHNSRVS